MRLRRSRRGSNAVEFALLLPVLCALVLGTLDYGQYFVTQHGMQIAAREAAAAGARDIEGDPVATALTQLGASLSNHAVYGMVTTDVSLDNTGPTPRVVVEIEVDLATTGFVPAPSIVIAHADAIVEAPPPDM